MIKRKKSIEISPLPYLNLSPDIEERRQQIQNTPENLDTNSWIDKPFLYPNRTIRLATTFSGIGAIEQV